MRDDRVQVVVLGDVPVPGPVQTRGYCERNEQNSGDRPHDGRCGAKAGELQRERGCGDGDDPVPMMDANQFGVRFDTICAGPSNSRKKRLRVSVVTRVRAGADSASREGMVPA